MRLIGWIFFGEKAGAKLSEYHTLTALLREACSSVCPWKQIRTTLFSTIKSCSGALAGLRDWGSSCPARYLPEASSINFRRSVRDGFGCILTAFEYRWANIRGGGL
jgi:hypothetical protein